MGRMLTGWYDRSRAYAESMRQPANDGSIAYRGRYRAILKSTLLGPTCDVR